MLLERRGHCAIKCTLIDTLSERQGALCECLTEGSTPELIREDAAAPAARSADEENTSFITFKHDLSIAGLHPCSVL